jgi:hypothetical protein
MMAATKRPQAGEADETVCPTLVGTAGILVARAVSPATSDAFVMGDGPTPLFQWPAVESSFAP